MSRDVQLGWNCPHLTLEERVTLSSDRRSLPTLQPIANRTIVSVLADYDVQIPRDGLYSQAKLISFQAGPYSLIENETDLTVVTSGESFPVSLSAAKFYTADEIATLINRASTTKKTVASSQNGRLTVTDTASLGPRSIVQVFGLSLPKLGFETQSGAQGKMLYPPWELYTPPTEITSRYIRFTQPLTYNPVLAVSYVTTQQRCLRCQGTGVENDYRFTATASVTTNGNTVPAGSIVTIENEDLLYQASLKIVLTKRGSNPFHPSYGSTVMSRIGSKSLAATAAAINQDVIRALQLFQDTQNLQAQYQNVTARERLYTIQSVNTQPDPNDPTVYYVNVTVQNASTAPVTLNIVYATSGVNSRNGTLTLGNQAFGGTAR